MLLRCRVRVSGAVTPLLESAIKVPKVTKNMARTKHLMSIFFQQLGVSETGPQIQHVSLSTVYGRRVPTSGADKY